jgi:hypothetical protein
MGKSKVLKIRPNAKAETRHQERWTGINKVWWVIIDNKEEVGKGSTPSNAWKNAYSNVR